MTMCCQVTPTTYRWPYWKFQAVRKRLLEIFAEQLLFGSQLAAEQMPSQHPQPWNERCYWEYLPYPVCSALNIIPPPAWGSRTNHVWQRKTSPSIILGFHYWLHVLAISEDLSGRSKLFRCKACEVDLG